MTIFPGQILLFVPKGKEADLPSRNVGVVSSPVMSKGCAASENERKISDIVTLQWRYNGRNGISNHQPHHCLLNCLFRRWSKKIPKLYVTGLCAGNSPVTGEFPTQMTSVSIWWRPHGHVMTFATFGLNDIFFYCFYCPQSLHPVTVQWIY